MTAPAIGATNRRHMTTPPTPVVEEEKGAPKAQASMRWDSSPMRPPMSPDTSPVRRTAVMSRRREVPTRQTLPSHPRDHVL